MTDLVDAYQRDDIHRYESILKENQDLLADPFIAENIDEVSRNMRTKAVLKLIAPYTRFTLKFISKHIKIPVSEVQDILGVLIVDKKLHAKINQENGTVEVEDSRGSDMEHLNRLRDWTSAVENLWTTVFNDGDGFKLEDTQGGAGFSGMNFPVGFDPAGPIPSRGPGRRGVGRGRGGGKLVAPI
jgi:COP9 signalosome complex subunit 2